VSTPASAITPPAASARRWFCPIPFFIPFLFLALLLPTAFAQSQQGSQSQTTPPAQSTDQQKKDDQGYRIRSTVDLVVLHASVYDKDGNFVPNLREENFHVSEANVEQKIALFKREDIPVSMGIVVDNSGSMRSKRPRVNAAAITFVQTSNPQDEAFVVNFNDEYYLDMDKDFSSDPKDLKEALDRIDSRGSTALYDAIIGSLDHLQKGTRDKKVLLVITDGEDNASRKNLAYTVQAAQQSNAVIYAIGLFSEDDKSEKKRATKALKEITEATGGQAYFPKDVDEVQSLCTRIAHDLRNQYLIAYYPTNTAKDGTYRTVQLQVIPPKGSGKLTVRTRPGYYASKAPAAP
jgi:Ca-activated chloride channel family protein